MAYSKHVPSADRPLNLLESLSKVPGGLTAGELPAGLDIPGTMPSASQPGESHQ